MNSGDSLYIWQQADWPDWRYDHAALAEPLASVHRAQGHLLGRMADLGLALRNQASLQVLTEDVLKTSEIEGEQLDPHAVRSSVARRLGVDIGALVPADRYVDGVVEMVLDAAGQYARPLTVERLFGWHAALFPTGYSGLASIRVGAWRDDASGPMQVVSGSIGRQKVHYQAPPALRFTRDCSLEAPSPLMGEGCTRKGQAVVVWGQSPDNTRSDGGEALRGDLSISPSPQPSPVKGEGAKSNAQLANEQSGLNAEMARFLDWLDQPGTDDLVIKAGLAHLWFVTLHPFDDGNGRIARAVGDMVLARAENSAQRFYSLSAQIQRERRDYYTLLEQTQKGGMDVTRWLSWFLGCLLRAIQGAETALAMVLSKAKFWQRWSGTPMNQRQIKLLSWLLDGFEGKLTSSKWAAIAKYSPDTALRDINDLLDIGVLKKSESGGRSTSYELAPLP